MQKVWRSFGCYGILFLYYQNWGYAMTTLKDIANATGYSLSTISYVLNGKKKVKPETYERIMEAVEKLNYHPNQLARALKMRKTCTIGVIVPDISNEFFPEILKGIDLVAHQNGYNIFLCNTNNRSVLEKECIDMLVSKDVDGIIFIGAADSKVLQDSEITVPIVLVDRKIGNAYTSIVTDNYRGGYMATKHLMNCGYKNIAFLGGDPTIPNFFERISGYKDALKERGIPCAEDNMVICECSMAGGYHAVTQLFCQNQQPEAVFAASDIMALGALRALRDKGLRVPEDVALMGFDDIPLASHTIPSLSTVSQPKFDMGKTAAEKLLQQILNKQNTVEHIVLQPMLMIRETTVRKGE